MRDLAAERNGTTVSPPFGLTKAVSIVFMPRWLGLAASAPAVHPLGWSTEKEPASVALPYGPEAWVHRLLVTLVTTAAAALTFHAHGKCAANAELFKIEFSGPPDCPYL